MGIKSEMMSQPVVPVRYLRVIRWVEEANDVAQQRRSVAKHQIEGDHSYQTCRGRERVSEPLDKRNTMWGLLAVNTASGSRMWLRTQHQDEEERQAQVKHRSAKSPGRGSPISMHLRSHRVM